MLCISWTSTAKKANILSGIQSLPPLTDAAITIGLLNDELGIGATVVRCPRLGKPSANNQPHTLLATLLSDSDASTAICSARKLSSSTNVYVHYHVYLNADLTPEQRKLDPPRPKASLLE